MEDERNVRENELEGWRKGSGEHVVERRKLRNRKKER